MASAVTIGARIRTLQNYTAPPDPSHNTANIATAPGADTRLSNNVAHDAGTIVLGSDGSARVEGVPKVVWDFAISGYALLPRWLAHRTGQRVDAAVLDAVRDLVGRVASLISLMAQADAVLVAALSDPLFRSDLGM
jgi:hypothetical protein